MNFKIILLVKIFNITTVCFVVSAKYVLTNKSAFNGGKVGTIEIPYERSLDLDTEFDLKLANLLNK